MAVFFFFAPLLLFVFSDPPSARQRSPGGAEAQLEAAVQEALAASKELAKTLMPAPSELGEGWKYPWELPEPARRKAPSEDAYWELATEKLPPTGLDPEQAAIAVDLSANAVSQAGASEGLSRRDAVMLMLHNTRQHNIPFAQRLLEGLNLTAVVYRERARLGENAQTGETAEHQLIDRVLQPYRSFDDAALERMAAQEISLVRRRIPMTYFKSNDWPGLIESRLDDEEMVEQGIWLAVVELELMLLDPNPLTWPPDLTEQNATKMQQRTLALFRELLLAETNRRRQQLVDDTAERIGEIEERLRSETDEKRREQLLAQRRRIEEEFEKEQKKLLESSRRVTQGLDVRIYMRDFGEHCHVFKLSGVSPDAVGLEASAYSAWLRNGRAVSRISRGFEPDLSGLSESAKRAKLIARWKQDATIWRTLRDAAENKVWIKQLPKELRDRALRRSNAIMRHNLWARQPERREVMRLSNIVEEHLEKFEKVAKARNEIYVFRSVNPDAKRLIKEHFATKDMHIKGKSSDWGPHAGFIPVDQQFSKLGNPERIARAKEAGELKDVAEELGEFYKKMKDCFAAGDCHQAPVRFEDGSRVVIIPADPAAGRVRHLPVLEKDGKLLDRKVDPENPERFIYEEIHVSGHPADRPKPMMVVADKNGVPITADYDFLAFGMEGRHSSPTFDPDKGFIEKRQWKALDKINEAAERAGYEGGRIAHHGAENWFPFSPGAMTVDPYVTVVGPEGLTHIPRCNAECMQRWCDTTHLCGGLSICIDNPPRNPPCFPVDPDRLLKDYFHSARLRGWNLDPNSKWGWGDYNVIGGWNAQNFLKQGEQGGWRLGSLSEIHPAVARMARRAMVTGIEGLKGGMEYLFECRTPEAGEEAGG